MQLEFSRQMHYAGLCDSSEAESLSANMKPFGLERGLW